MKQKSNSKRLFVALSLALVLMLAIGGLIGLESAPVVHADDTTLTTTYLSGFHTNNQDTIKVYWLASTTLGYTDGDQLAQISVPSVVGGVEGNRTLNLTYSTATVGGPNIGIGLSSDRRYGSVVNTSSQPNHPVIQIAVSGFKGAAGNTFTIPKGTTLADSDGNAKYVLDQDYKFVLNSTCTIWELDDSSKIPLTLSGARTGDATYFYAYGVEKLAGYYEANTNLNNFPASKGPISVVYNKIDSTTSTLYATFQYAIVDSTVSALKVSLYEWDGSSSSGTAKSLTYGESIIIPKGSKLDNYVFDRDYTFTYIDGSNTYDWSMSASANDDDATMTLEKRGGNGDTLNLFTTSELPFDDSEYFAYNTIVYVDDEVVYSNYFIGLSMSGTNYSFGVRFSSALSNNSVVTFPKDMVIYGYRLDKDYQFQWNGSAWSAYVPPVEVTLTGVRGGSDTYVYVYGARNLQESYSSNDRVASDVSLSRVDADGNAQDSVTAYINFAVVSAGSAANKTALYIGGWSAGDVAVGDVLTLAKGTYGGVKFTNDYKFTYIESSKWSMEAIANDDDETLSLSLIGGAIGNLALEPTTPDNSTLVQVVNEDIANNVKIQIYDASAEKAVEMYATKWVAKADLNTSGARIDLNLTGIAVGDIIYLPKDMMILGYKLDKTYYFLCTQTSAPAWKLIDCDGINHNYSDDITCHDRTCSCGHVEEATGEHTFADGTYACQERICTACNQTISASAHTIPQGDYECTGYICSVCKTVVDADTSKHVATSESTGCVSTCQNCNEQYGSHSYPETPSNGWSKDDSGLTITTEPTCTQEGIGTIACAECDATEVVAVNALGHTMDDDGHFCIVCDYRVNYDADDMAEILALASLQKYTYSQTTAVNGSKGQLVAETNNRFTYDTQADNAHNMLVSFSLNLSAYATNGRSSYVWLNSDDIGYFGIGFQFSLYNDTQNLRITIKKDDNTYYTYKDSDIKTLVNFALNTKQSFRLGAIQNYDGSWFVFAYHDSGNGEQLVLTLTISKEDVDTYGASMGDYVSFDFATSSSATAPVGTICDLEHSVESTQYVCKDYYCTVCGVKAVTHTADHSWGEGAEKTPANCTSPAVYEHTCTVCGEVESYNYGEPVHNWDTKNPEIITPASCGGANSEGIDQVVVYTCSVCNTKSEQITLEGTGYDGPHSYSYQVQTPATCISKGLTVGTCTRCGAQDSVEIPVNANAHNYGNEIAKVAETCATAGTLAHYECSLCEKIFVLENGNYVEKTADELVIPAGHKYQAVAEDPATCTENGMLAHYTCSGCDKLFVKDGENYVEKTAEQLVIVAGHNYVEGVCSVCQAKDNLYFFNQAMADVTSATTAEAKFNALKVAIEKYNLLSSEEKASNKATIDAQITAYNTMATQANQAHGRQTDTVATILGWVASVSALAAAALVLKKIIR